MGYVSEYSKNSHSSKYRLKLKKLDTVKDIQDYGLSVKVTFAFLASSEMKLETEKFIMACQHDVTTLVKVAG